MINDKTYNIDYSYSRETDMIEGVSIDVIKDIVDKIVNSPRYNYFDYIYVTENIELNGRSTVDVILDAEYDTMDERWIITTDDLNLMDGMI